MTVTTVHCTMFLPLQRDVGDNIPSLGTSVLVPLQAGVVLFQISVDLFVIDRNGSHDPGLKLSGTLIAYEQLRGEWHFLTTPVISEPFWPLLP